MIMRLLLLGLLVYIVYKIFRDWADKPGKKEEVQGKRQTKPLDLKNADVQDARFEDLDEKKRS